MDIYFKNNTEGKLLEFLGFYEKLLANLMDPFRRCRSGNFDAQSLEKRAIDAFLAFKTPQKEEKLNELFLQTNHLLESYYAKTKKDFAIAPDIFSFRNVVENKIQRIYEEN